MDLCKDVSDILKLCFCFDNEAKIFFYNKINFDKIIAFSDFDILRFLAKTQWKDCLINSFYNFSNQSETLHKC